MVPRHKHMRRVRPFITAGPWLRYLKRQVSAVLGGRDSEAVHQIRVAVARLRVWLALGRWHVIDDDLRWLRDEAAAVRDIEVQMEQHPPERWAVHLRGQRVKAQRRLRRALAGDRLAGTLEALRVLPPFPQDIARRRARSFARRALERGENLCGKSSNISALHALRCALRRLRYALDWLGEDSARIANLHQLIGDACDRYVALEGLRRDGAGRRERRYRHRLERELSHFVDRALSTWKVVRPGVQELCHGSVRYPARRRSPSLEQSRRRLKEADGSRSPPVAESRARIPAARRAA